MRVKEFKEVISTENIHREYITVDGIKYATLSMADFHENKCFRAKERYLRLHRIAPEIYTIQHLKEIFWSCENNRYRLTSSSKKDYEDFSSSQWGLCQAIRVLTNRSTFAKEVYPAGIEAESNQAFE